MQIKVERTLALWLVLGAISMLIFVTLVDPLSHGSVELLSGGEKLEMRRSEGAHKTHVAHAAHKKLRGSKYTRELQSLARRAGPSRENAMAKLEALRNRAEGKSSTFTSSAHKRKKIPQALRNMEKLANQRADFSHHAGSGADMLGKLERAHGIRSSKDMLAEIMSLRHYKKSDKEISEMQHGFEAHSSMSKRIMRSMEATKDKSLQEQTSADQRQEASALRLEAGRFSRSEMLQRTEERIEHKIGHSLLETFKPIKAVLKRDEKTLDDLTSPSKQRELQDAIVSNAANKVKRVLRATLRREADRKIHQEKDKMYHESKQYLTKVHTKTLSSLSHVVDPSIFDVPDGELQLLPQHLNASLSAPATDSTNSVAQPWNRKLEAFLLDTNKYIQKLARPLELRLDPFSSPASSSSSASPPSASSAAAAVAPRSSVFTSFSDLSKIMGFNTPTNKKRKASAASSSSPIPESEVENPRKTVGEDSVINAMESHLQQELESAEGLAGKKWSQYHPSLNAPGPPIASGESGRLDLGGGDMSPKNKRAFTRALEGYL